jgi:hypothetical protein
VTIEAGVGYTVPNREERAMTITLPADVREQAERQAKAAGFASVEEYLADLVREDTESEPPPPDPLPFDRERLGKLLDETLGDGRVLADEAFWAEEERKLTEYAAERARNP